MVTRVAASALSYTCCDAEPPGRVILIGDCVGLKLCFVVPTVRGLSVGVGGGQGALAAVGLQGVGDGAGPAAYDELVPDRTSTNKATSMKRTRYMTDPSLKSKQMPRQKGGP